MRKTPNLTCRMFAGQARNCWAVGFGDCHTADDRCLLAGYDNGDIKMFDLRTNSCAPFPYASQATTEHPHDTPVPPKRPHSVMLGFTLQLAVHYIWVVLMYFVARIKPYCDVRRPACQPEPFETASRDWVSVSGPRGRGPGRRRVRWEETLGNGVCGVAFDRPSIAMNKIMVATLQGLVHVFDVRTRHPTTGAPSRLASRQCVLNPQSSGLLGLGGPA